jgi:RNA polymerase sigma factor (sigma-70 family)
MSTTTSDFLRHLRTLAARQAIGGLSDQQLLERFRRERSEASFALLVQRHGPMVLSVCRRVLHHVQDVEDAFQATFLVLARKAAMLHQPPLLGSWLHGVAYHVALRLKAKAQRRAAHEHRVDPLPPGNALDDITWREVRSVLDEELGKMPEQYRAPLVLCYLEARTQDEAARHLGWSKNTFTRRLNQARQMLARRLTRRGLTLSTVLTAPLLLDGSAQAALPALLASSTVRAGLASATGQALDALVSAQVVALAEGGVASLLAKKVSIAVVVLVSLTLGVGGLLAYRAVSSRTFAEAPATSPAPATQTLPARSTSKGKNVEIKGRVLDPDGKPLAGAKVYVSTYTEKDKSDPKVRTETDANGRFHFTASRAEVDRDEMLAVVAPGYGPDWVSLSQADDGSELSLRLVKDDAPINGRVLDLENQPIVGAKVRVVRVRKMPNEDLGPWIKDMQAVGNKGLFDLRRSNALLRYEQIMKPVWGVLGTPHAAKVGADGRFHLAGFGRERVVELVIEGPGVEHSQVTVVTRSELPKGLPPYAYGARFDFRAAPDKPIVGTIREKGSGKPLPGIEVTCDFVSVTGGSTDLTPVEGTTVTTDAQGRYRLPGSPKSKQYHIEAKGDRYFGATKVVNDSPGSEPLVADFEMEVGILIRGRVKDKATGRPVPGLIFYLPRGDNPRLKDYPEFAADSTSNAEIEKDGSFTVPAIPGRGWICVRAADDRFMRAELAEDPAKLPILLQYFSFHAIAAIDVSEKAPNSLKCDFVLDPGRTLQGKVCGPDGKPLAGVFAAGLTSAPSVPLGSQAKPKLMEAEFSAVALDPGRPRTLVFWSEEKKLAKAVLPRGDEAQVLTVRLEPLGAATGLLVDAAGHPLAGAKIEARYSKQQTKTLPGELGKGIPGLVNSALPFPKAASAHDGRFRIEGLISGLKYDLFVRQDKKESRLADDLSVPGGQCKDLGEVRADRKTTK